MDLRAIGIFDSGFGGISVLRDIAKVMPNENLIYYGDSANAPYAQNLLRPSCPYLKTAQTFSWQGM